MFKIISVTAKVKRRGLGKTSCGFPPSVEWASRRKEADLSDGPRANAELLGWLSPFPCVQCEALSDLETQCQGHCACISAGVRCRPGLACNEAPRTLQVSDFLSPRFT